MVHVSQSKRKNTAAHDDDDDSLSIGQCLTTDQWQQKKLRVTTHNTIEEGGYKSEGHHQNDWNALERK